MMIVLMHPPPSFFAPHPASSVLKIPRMDSPLQLSSLRLRTRWASFLPRDPNYF